MLDLLIKPGLGFEINQKLLKKYGKRFFNLIETRLELKVIGEKGIRTARKETQ